MKRAIRLWTILCFFHIFIFCVNESIAFSYVRHKKKEVIMSNQNIRNDNIQERNDKDSYEYNEGKAVSKSSVSTLDRDNRKEGEGRELGAGEAIQRLFATPVNQWTLAQWGLLLVLIWLVGHFLRRCPCIYDMIACYCCYELFCDPEPAGFIAC